MLYSTKKDNITYKSIYLLTNTIMYISYEISKFVVYLDDGKHIYNYKFADFLL